MNKADKAESLFRTGYNCSQSVYAAFAEELGITVEEAAKKAIEEIEEATPSLNKLLNDDDKEQEEKGDKQKEDKEKDKGNKKKEETTET